MQEACKKLVLTTFLLILLFLLHSSGRLDPVVGDVMKIDRQLNKKSLSIVVTVFAVIIGGVGVSYALTLKTTSEHPSTTTIVGDSLAVGSSQALISRVQISTPLVQESTNFVPAGSISGTGDNDDNDDNSQHVDDGEHEDDD